MASQSPAEKARALLQHAVGLHQQGKVAEAEPLYRQALALSPNDPDALHLLGVARRALGEPLDAIPLIRKALEISPGLHAAHRNLGNAYSDSGQYALAADHYRRFLAVESDKDVWISLGTAMKFQGQRAESLDAYDRAVALAPDESQPRFERGLGRIYFGDFAGGWSDWEHRWSQPKMAEVRPKLGGEQWDGQDPAGKTILVYAEQGFGDTFQFVRYLPELVARGAKVIFCGQIELDPMLAAALPPEITLLPSGQAAPDYHWHAPLLSLPGLMGTTLDTIPTRIPYLAADPVLADQWGSRIRELAPGGALRVGLVWTGRPTHGNDRHRSIGPETLAPVLRLGGAAFFSLQKEPRPGHLEILNGFGPVVDLGPYLNDFRDTAAALSHMDLLISVDTSVAHLAGSLGVPVWLLLPLNADWRWVHGRDTTPWYPDWRLFRQTNMGDWDAVLTRVAKALEQKVVGPLTAPQIIELAVQGKTEKALAGCRQLERCHADNPDVINLARQTVALAHVLAGDLKTAETAFARARGLAEGGLYSDLLGTLARMLPDRLTRVTAMDLAIRSHPGNPLLRDGLETVLTECRLADALGDVRRLDEAPAATGTVRFETKVWEGDWEILLTEGRLEEMIARCAYPFDERVLVINNVDDRAAVEKAAGQLVNRGVLTGFVNFLDRKDQVLARIGLKEADFGHGFVYSIAELVGVFDCTADYLLHFSGDSIVADAHDWVTPSLAALQEQPLLAVANPLWGTGLLSQARNDAIAESDRFLVSFGFSDQCYLVRTAEFQDRIYHLKHYEGRRYPAYGGELFEKRVNAWLRTMGRLRLTYKGAAYVHQNLRKESRA
jgi:hypothetical protein